MKVLRQAILVLFLVFPVSGKDGDAVNVPVPAGPKPLEPETGIASWYGYPYHGRQAADGEIYDMEKLTAAHRTLPFGTWVRVVNLRNEMAVTVRITDRGPFIDGRIIDLSRAAARAVDMLTPGISAVRLELISEPNNETGTSKEVPDRSTQVAAGLFAVQVGAFKDRGNAEHYLAIMQSRYGSGRIVAREGDPVLWRVLVGSEKTQEGAIVLAARIRQESAEQIAFVARVGR